MNNKKRPLDKVKIDTRSMTGHLVDVSEIHLNVTQEVIITTEDKINLCLSEHLKRIERKRSWIAPFGILIAIVLTLVTSSFKENVLQLTADTWRAIFIIAGLICLGWLIRSIIEAIKSVKVEDIVEKLKKSSRKNRK